MTDGRPDPTDPPSQAEPDDERAEDLDENIDDARRQAQDIESGDTESGDSA